MTRVSVAVTGVTPRRELYTELLSQLDEEAKRLGGRSIDLVLDVKMTRRCWTGHRMAYRVGLRADPTADWHVVLEDDALVCRNFIAGVEAALSVVPPRGPVVLYHQAHALRDLGESGWAYSTTNIYDVAVALPRALIPEFLDWSTANVRPTHPHPGDHMSLWCMHTNRVFMIAWPCLVEHRDGRSMLGHSNFGRPRKAAGWAYDLDPTKLDWTRRLNEPLQIKGLPMSAFKYWRLNENG